MELFAPLLNHWLDSYVLMSHFNESLSPIILDCALKLALTLFALQIDASWMVKAQAPNSEQVK